MKIATYNIWNDERGWPDRLDQIYNEIVKQKSDIICLQDVPSEENCKILAEKCNYEFYYYINQSDTCELAILSKHPFVSTRSYSEAHCAHITLEEPYKSAYYSGIKEVIMSNNNQIKIIDTIPLYLVQKPL